MSELQENTKKVKFDLTSVNGNAFVLMGGFQRQARHDGWTKEEINEVLAECQKGDYNHLVQTLMRHCE